MLNMSERRLTMAPPSPNRSVEKRPRGANRLGEAASAKTAQVPKHDDPRHRSCQNGDADGDNEDRRVAFDAEIKSAEQRADILAPDAVRPPSRYSRRAGEENGGQGAPEQAATQAETQKMDLELSGNIAVGRADEMQHFDDLAVSRHGPARGEADRHGHRRNHQDEQKRSENDDRIGHRVEPRQPKSVIVETGVGGLRGESLTQGRYVRRV